MSHKSNLLLSKGNFCKLLLSHFTSEPESVNDMKFGVYSVPFTLGGEEK